MTGVDSAAFVRTVHDYDAAGEMMGGLFYGNYLGGSGLMAGAVFGKQAGESAANTADAASQRRAHG